MSSRHDNRRYLGRVDIEALRKIVCINPESPSHLSWLWRPGFISRAGEHITHIGNHGYYVFRHRGKGYLAHRVVYELLHGPLENNQEVDHMDRNKLNNDPANLRIAVRNDNCRNTRMFATNTSGYRGVCWAKHAKKWKAAITINDRVIHIGYYTDLLEAAKAYDRAAIEAHGTFARLNFAPKSDNRSLANG